MSIKTKGTYRIDEEKLAHLKTSEVHWPIWKVTVSVLAFCALFWGGVGYLLARLF